MSEEEQQDSNGTMNGDVPEIELIIKVRGQQSNIPFILHLSFAINIRYISY